MRHLLVATIAALVVSNVAYAQQAPPAPQAPTNQMQQAAPPTKPAASQSAEPSAKPATFVPDQQWVGRYVYSSDDKELGKIKSVKTSGTSNQVFFDMGGFLGLGATRKSVTSNQILDVNKDRIVLRLTEAEAQKLPAAEK